jgi:hypothetical protein
MNEGMGVCLDVGIHHSPRPAITHLGLTAKGKDLQGLEGYSLLEQAANGQSLRAMQICGEHGLW